MSILDSEQKLEAAANLAEPASEILYKFSNNPVGADPIITDSGVIPSLADVIEQIFNTGVVSVPTLVYPTIADGITGTADNQIFVVKDTTDNVFKIYENINDAVIYLGTASIENFSTALKTKLDGVEALATKNDTDANLRARASHTGTQATSTIDGLDTFINQTGTSLTNLNNAINTNINKLVVDGSNTSNFTAVAGKSYWLRSTITVVTLPTVTGLAIGSTVTFTKALTASVTINRFASDTALIVTEKQSDTSALYNLNAEITFTFNGTNWEL